MNGSKTQVVNLRTSGYDVYLGRPKAGQHWGFGNPFMTGRDGNRDAVIEKFEQWLLHGRTFNCVDATESRRQWMLDNLHKLKGKRIGCFCSPKACHGDVLARIESDRNTAY